VDSEKVTFHDKNQFKDWGHFIECIHGLPLTWVPAALLVMVEEAVRRRCFKPGGLQEAINQKLIVMANPDRAEGEKMRRKNE
jgi:hypothetical protein